MADSNPKAALRRDLRNRRRGLSAVEQKAHAAALCSVLAHTPFLQTARRIACYCALDGEVDTSPVIDWCRRMHKRVFLPVISPIVHDRLWFAELTPQTPLSPNRFGILEPAVPRRELVRAQHLDLILLPLVGFDRYGNRLGMGAGFYDRSLAFRQHRRYYRRPLVVGVAHELQRVEKLNPDPWDVPLDAVVTERRVYAASSD